MDLLLSLEWLGIGATLPAGTLIQKYGLRVGALIGLLVPTAAHLLIWSACRRPDWYSRHYYLLATYFFLAGKSLSPNTVKPVWSDHTSGWSLQTRGRWSACRRPDWYSRHYYLLATYFFLAGNSPNTVKPVWGDHKSGRSLQTGGRCPVNSAVSGGHRLNKHA